MRLDRELTPRTGTASSQKCCIASHNCLWTKDWGRIGYCKDICTPSSTGTCQGAGNGVALVLPLPNMAYVNLTLPTFA